MMISKGLRTRSLFGPVQIMVGKSVATMGYLNREDTRRYLRSDTRASDFSKEARYVGARLTNAASGTNGSSVATSDARAGA